MKNLKEFKYFDRNNNEIEDPKVRLDVENGKIKWREPGSKKEADDPGYLVQPESSKEKGYLHHPKNKGYIPSDRIMPAATTKSNPQQTQATQSQQEPVQQEQTQAAQNHQTIQASSTTKTKNISKSTANNNVVSEERAQELSNIVKSLSDNQVFAQTAYNSFAKEGGFQVPLKDADKKAIRKAIQKAVDLAFSQNKDVISYVVNKGVPAGDTKLVPDPSSFDVDRLAEEVLKTYIVKNTAVQGDKSIKYMYAPEGSDPIGINENERRYLGDLIRKEFIPIVDSIKSQYDKGYDSLIYSCTRDYVSPATNDNQASKKTEKTTLVSECSDVIIINRLREADEESGITEEDEEDKPEVAEKADKKVDKDQSTSSKTTKTDNPKGLNPLPLQARDVQNTIAILNKGGKEFKVDLATHTLEYSVANVDTEKASFDIIVTRKNTVGRAEALLNKLKSVYDNAGQIAAKLNSGGMTFN